IMKISACLIVKNETDHIEDVLDTLFGFDEIIVCDTGSTDDTVELAFKHTDHVFTDYVWNDNFAEARNHANSKATGDWIFTIDADEFLRSPLSLLKEKAIEAEEKGFNSVSCNVKSLKYPDIHTQPRL